MVFKKISAHISAICLAAISTNAASQNVWDAYTLYRRINDAAYSLKNDCGVDILSRTFPIEFSCSGKFTTAGEAWSNALNKSGIPSDIGERERISRSIGLDPTDEFTFASGRANEEALARLLFNLKILSEKQVK